MAESPTRVHRRAGNRAGNAARGGQSSRSDVRAAARTAQRGRRRKALKVTSIAVSVVVLAAAGTLYYLYKKLNGNIHTTSISAKSGGVEKKDAFGRSPINVLVIGSDARNSKEDCALGGDCKSGGGERADVEMVVHLSADRTNGTVMSIPRDLVTDLPACQDAKTGRSAAERTDMINSALDYGADCQVTAVHHLTGIPIDHFVQVDFAGVVSMSNAVGGAKVCVDHNVYDPLSHLKLKRGSHVLKGVAALEFLRTRHGFGDGSDNVGRTNGQHIFLSALLNQLKSAGTLTNPVESYKLANAATKSLTVDTKLGSIPKLVGLAQDFSKVPSSRMTFTTMQNYADPDNTARVLQGPGAATLFRTIADDQSLTTAGGKKTSGTTPSAKPVDPATVAVQVENGTTTSGRATTVLGRLQDAGFSPASTAGNYTGPSTVTSTTLTYPPGKAAEAKAVAAALGLPASHEKPGTDSGLVLVVGTDWISGSTYPGGHAAATSAETAKALNNSLARTAAQSSQCVKVSTQRTIPISASRGITPEQSYEDHPEVKDSAP